MTEVDVLAQRFEERRPRLESIACRILGSRAEAEKAVQDERPYRCRLGGGRVPAVTEARVSGTKIFFGRRDATGLFLFEAWGSGHLDISPWRICAENFEVIAGVGVKKICDGLRNVSSGTVASGLFDETVEELLDHLSRGNALSGEIALPFDALSHAPVPVGLVLDEVHATVDVYRPDVHALDDVPAPPLGGADVGPYQCVLRVTEKELVRFGEKLGSLDSMNIDGPNQRMFWEEAFLRRRNKRILNIPTPPRPPTAEELAAAAREKEERARDRQRRTDVQMAAAQKDLPRLEELCADGKGDVVNAALETGIRRGDAEVLRFCLARGGRVSWDDTLRLIDRSSIDAVREILLLQSKLLEPGPAVAPDLLCARGPVRIEVLLAAGATIPEWIIARGIEIKNVDVLRVIAPHNDMARAALASWSVAPEA